MATKKTSSWIIREISFATFQKGEEVKEAELKKSLQLLEKGVEEWNEYREEHPEFIPYLKNINLSASNKYIPESLEGINFSGAILEDSDLSDIHLRDADLSRAKAMRAKFVGTDLTKVCFDEAKLMGTNFNEAFMSFATFNDADLSESNLDDAELMCCSFQDANLTRASLYGSEASDLIATGANFTESRLIETDLSGADLVGANLSYALCIRTNFREANLSESRVFGVSVWDADLKGALQIGLKISKDESFDEDENTILVDDIEVAQFIHLLINHTKLNKAINAVTQKGVLLLGRFKEGGYEDLQKIATKLRVQNYLPIIFDFERPTDRNYTETVKTLAGMVRFVIADLSGPSVPQELYATVPHYKIPFLLLSQNAQVPYSMVQDILEYDWVIKPLLKYENIEELLKVKLDQSIIAIEKKLSKREKLLKELYDS